MEGQEGARRHARGEVCNHTTAVSDEMFLVFVTTVACNTKVQLPVSEPLAICDDKGKSQHHILATVPVHPYPHEQPTRGWCHNGLLLVIAGTKKSQELRPAFF